MTHKASIACSCVSPILLPILSTPLLDAEKSILLVTGFDQSQTTQTQEA